jgi:two-component system, NarL family, response regulator LiaR
MPRATGRGLLSDQEITDELPWAEGKEGLQVIATSMERDLGRSVLRPDGLRSLDRAKSDPRSAETERVRLIVADPDPLARRSIRDSLSAGKGIVVVAEARDGVELVELASHYKPELVLTEVGLPSIDGIEACRRIIAKAPRVRVVVFTVNQDRDLELSALRAGASGVLSKDTNAQSVIRAVRAVAGGEAAISRQLTMHLIEMMRRTAEGGAGLRPVKSVLTSREWEVLDLICTGASTREIAETLFLSEDTVYSHSKSILRKLGVHSRGEAVLAAEQLRAAAAA